MRTTDIHGVNVQWMPRIARHAKFTFGREWIISLVIAALAGLFVGEIVSSLQYQAHAEAQYWREQPVH